MSSFESREVMDDGEKTLHLSGRFCSAAAQAAIGWMQLVGWQAGGLDLGRVRQVEREALLLLGRACPIHALRLTGLQARHLEVLHRCGVQAVPTRPHQRLVLQSKRSPQALAP